MSAPLPLQFARSRKEVDPLQMDRGMQHRSIECRSRKVAHTIIFVTAYALFYQLAPSIGVSNGIIIGLFLLSPFLLAYMAYVILKYGEPSIYSFEEKFYEDRDIWRNGVHHDAAPRRRR